MPRIDERTVDSVARLARLSLTAEERSRFARELEAILAWAESLQALDTDRRAADERRAAAERCARTRRATACRASRRSRRRRTRRTGSSACRASCRDDGAG